MLDSSVRMAKFKGNADDWLDDEKSARKGGNDSRKRQRNKAFEQAKALAWEEANATVVEVFPKLCRVRLDQPLSSGAEILCHYRRAQVFGANHRQKGQEETRERTPVAVGDRVLVDAQQTIVENVCERKNYLARPAPGRARPGGPHEEAKLVQILAANLDLVVIVACAGTPEFTPGLVDRYLIACQSAGIPTLICINKMDLHSGEKPWDLYARLGFNVLEVSSKKEINLTALRAELQGKKIVFCGQSGVGKTSLLNALTQKTIGRTGDVSDSTAKGMHTTTSAVLLAQDQLPAGTAPNTQWIDTPGIREFGLVNVAEDHLRSFFPEFSHLACTARGCLHDADPACDALGSPRHSSYLRILASIREST